MLDQSFIPKIEIWDFWNILGSCRELQGNYGTCFNQYWVLAGDFKRIMGLASIIANDITVGSKMVYNTSMTTFTTSTASPMRLLEVPGWVRLSKVFLSLRLCALETREYADGGRT